MNGHAPTSALDQWMLHDCQTFELICIENLRIKNLHTQINTTQQSGNQQPEFLNKKLFLLVNST